MQYMNGLTLDFRIELLLSYSWRILGPVIIVPGIRSGIKFIPPLWWLRINDTSKLKYSITCRVY